MKSAEDIEKSIMDLRFTGNAAMDERILGDVASALERSHERLPVLRLSAFWRKSMTHRMKRVCTIAAGLAVVVGLTSLVKILAPDAAASGMAFGQVMARFSEIQTLHVRLDQKGKTAEAWARRPDQLRIEYADGTYELSNGATLWLVDPAANRATKKDSHYYRTARSKGVDVIDLIREIQFSDNLSGFFSTKPQERIDRDGRIFDVYRSDMDVQDKRWHCEALVDVETQFLHSVKVDQEQSGRRQTLFELIIFAYDLDILDEKFAFEPPVGMKVIVQQSKGPQAQPQTTPDGAAAQGSTLSGRVTWAESGKPVGGARLWCSGGEFVPSPKGGSRYSFFVRAETDREGVWQVKGAPAGPIQIGVRSWELNWPAMPAFESNVGTNEHSVVVVDGQSEYRGLDFNVHKPQKLFAQITIDVTDEDGYPVEGAGALLIHEGEGGACSVYAAEGQQFTGPNGKMVDTDIWPTRKPVRLSVSHNAAATPYVTRGVESKPFIVERGQSYHFDMMLPFARSMTVEVVDLEGRPLEGVSVAAADSESGFSFFPRYWERDAKPLLTDATGRATLDTLKAGETFVLILKRPAPGAKPDSHGFLASALASACIPLTVPSDRGTTRQTVRFDERPIRIEGTARLSGQNKLLSFTCGVPGAKHGEVCSLSRAECDDSGAFVLQGVPPGDVTLSYAYGPDRQSFDKMTRGEAVIHARPGTTSTVELTETGLTVKDVRPFAE